MTLVLLCITAYIVGSIPVGKIVAAIYGIDIQNTGTGNIGASNTYLFLGKRAGIIVLCGDLGKAYLMIQTALYTLSIGHALIVGVFLLLGNMKSIFLKKFTGGKGVATGLGIFLATEPIAAFVLVSFWGVALIFIRFIIISSVIGALLVPFVYYRYEHDLLTLMCSFILCVMILLRHKSILLIKEQESN